MEELEQAIATGATIYDAVFYGAAFLIAFIPGVLMAYLDRRYRGFSDVFAIGILSGVAGAAGVGAICGAAGATWAAEPRYLAIAAVVGFMGKSGIKVAAKFLGIDINGKDEDADGCRLPVQHTDHAGDNRDGGHADRVDSDADSVSFDPPCSSPRLCVPCWKIVTQRRH